MGLFKKSTPKETMPPATLNAPPCATEEELLERYAGIALEKQMDLGEVIGENNWNVDVTKGIISFGPELVFPMQIMGTIAHAAQSWLWAWANTQSGLPQNIMAQAVQLKKYGEENGIDLLASSSFGFTREELHIIGMIAAGMFGSSGYYIADYGQGAMVVTIQSDIVDQARNDTHQRILTVFPQLISQFDMNHKNALKHYLQAKGYTVSETDNTLKGVKGEDLIEAQFDAGDRLAELVG